jgi:hypothetical protein
MMVDHRNHRSSDENENDDDSGCGDIGILFESLHPTVIKRFVWGSPSCSRSDLSAAPTTDVISTSTITTTTSFAARDNIEWETRLPIEAPAASRRIHDTKERDETEEETIATLPTFPFVCALVRCIDDDPGAVVSGHYVWPASLSLCDYLVANNHCPCPRQGAVGLCSENDDGICEGVPSSGGSNDVHDNHNHTSAAAANNHNHNHNHNHIHIHNKNYNNNDDGDAQRVVRSVLELGAGSGIPSIVASQVFGDTLETLVVTDRDQTTLERARENYQRSMEEARRCSRGETTIRLELENTAPFCTRGSASTTTTTTAFAVAPPIRTEFLVLRWGSESDWQRLGECLNINETREPQKRKQPPPPPQKQGFFDLVVGSDLIDCVETVEPLFHTIARALKSGNNNNINNSNDSNNNNNNTHGRSRCLLSQSFAYDSETEDEIDAACDRFRLERRVLADERLVPMLPRRNGRSSSTGGSNGAASTMKIQEFRRKT